MSENTECPGCGRDDFDSQHSMRNHYGSSKDDLHEGSISWEDKEELVEVINNE